MLKKYKIEVMEDSVVSKTPKYFRELYKKYNDVDSCEYGFKTFATKQEAEDFILTLPTTTKLENFANTTYRYQVVPIIYEFCNYNGYSDTYPYEIVKVISDKTIEIREMDAEIKKDWKQDVILGGFAGHTVNNGGEWDIKPNEANPIIRARRSKHGQWKSKCGRHSLNTQPVKFYDYNF
tara:strand:- start:18 stop:554 length:537 start_codon:yes stop_codon:yes gene_type:complete